MERVPDEPRPEPAFAEALRRLVPPPPAVPARVDAAILAAARADVAGILGIVADPEHTRVVRHPHGIAQYRIGHREAVAAADSVAGRHRLVLAGSGWHGVGVTDCVSDATRIVAEVARW